MAYPQFALMTLQLIAPSSNMTLQEYKDAFGIDLTKTDIHAFKLVLFGDEKYAIDKIEDVEGGHEVYFSGRILSITDTIETSDEVYDVANSKPLYFHPLTIKNEDGRPVFVASMIVINNDPDPIDTWAKLTTFFNKVFDSLPDGITVARFPCTGYVKNASNTVITSVVVISGKTDSSRIFAGVDLVAGTYLNVTASDIPGTPLVDDGVNKIN